MNCEKNENNCSHIKYEPDILLLEPIVIKSLCQNAEKVSTHSLRKVVQLRPWREVTVGGLVPVHKPTLVPLPYSLVPTPASFLR